MNYLLVDFIRGFSVLFSLLREFYLIFMWSMETFIFTFKSLHFENLINFF